MEISNIYLLITREYKDKMAKENHVKIQLNSEQTTTECCF